MRIKINRPVQVSVNGQLRQFYRGEIADIPEDAVQRIERLLAGRRLPNTAEQPASAPVASASQPLVSGAEAGDTVEPSAGEREAATPPVASLTSEKPADAPQEPAPKPEAKPAPAQRKARAKKA
jgi:hypothetical protein